MRRWSRVMYLKLFSMAIALLVGWFSLSTDALAQTQGIAVTEEDVFVLPSQSGAVEVVDNLKVKNEGQSPASMKLTLPQGAENVKLSKDGKVVSTTSAATAIVPGVSPKATTNIVVTYVLALSAQHDVLFTLHPNYPVYLARVYLPIGNASISAQGLLTDTSTVTINGMKFRMFTRPGIPANSDWTLSVQMLPSVTSNPHLGAPVIGTRPDDFVNTLQAVGNLLVAVLILTVGLISIRATQWGRAAKVHLSRDEALMRSWENIELQYQDGAINELEYQARRQQIKDKLLISRKGAPG